MRRLIAAAIGSNVDAMLLMQALGDDTVATFTKGQQFNCTSTICYGIGAQNHEMFLSVQRNINAIFTLLNQSSWRITLDGKFGSGTVTALKRLAVWASANMPGTRAAGAFTAATTITAAATLVPTLMSATNDVIQALNERRSPAAVASTSIAPSAPTDTARAASGVPSAPETPAAGVSVETVAPATTTTVGKTTTTTTVTVEKPSWLWWALAGVGTVALVGVGIVVYKRSKASQTPEQAADRPLLPAAV